MGIVDIGMLIFLAIVLIVGMSYLYKYMQD
jgi:hypothetical protein